MKTIILLLCLGLGGCATMLPHEVDVSNNPKYQCAYKINEIYSAKKKLWLVHSDTKNILIEDDEILSRISSQVEMLKLGSLEVGTKLRITKLTKGWDSVYGNYIDAQAEIMTGQFEGYLVLINNISNRHQENIDNVDYSCVAPDWNILELVQ